MEKYSIISIDDIDTEQISFDSIGLKCPTKKTIKYKNALCFIKIINTTFPFGITKSVNNYWSLCCQLNDTQINKFNKIDELLIGFGMKHYQELFELWKISTFDDISGERISNELIESIIRRNYTTIIKNGSSIINIGIGNTDQSDCYNFDLFIENKIDLIKIKPNNTNGDENNVKNYIIPGTIGSVLFEPIMWISKNEYGVILNCYQIKTTKAADKRNKKICYLD